MGPTLRETLSPLYKDGIRDISEMARARAMARSTIAGHGRPPPRRRHRTPRRPCPRRKVALIREATGDRPFKARPVETPRRRGHLRGLHLVRHQSAGMHPLPIDRPPIRGAAEGMARCFSASAAAPRIRYAGDAVRGGVRSRVYRGCHAPTTFSPDGRSPLTDPQSEARRGWRPSCLAHGDPTLSRNDTQFPAAFTPAWIRPYRRPLGPTPLSAARPPHPYRSSDALRTTPRYLRRQHHRPLRNTPPAQHLAIRTGRYVCPGAIHRHRVLVVDHRQTPPATRRCKSPYGPCPVS